MTLEQEMYFIKKHAREDGYAEGYRVAVAEKEEAVKEALQEKEQAVNEEKLENARKLKESGVSVEIISKCKAFPWSRFGNCKVIFTDWHVK